MSLRIFLVCCIMIGCLHAAPIILARTTTLSRSSSTTAPSPAEASTTEKATMATTEAPTTEPIQTAVACNMDQGLHMDSSKPILGDIPVVPDHSHRVQVLNRGYVPLKTCKELFQDGFNKSGLYVVKPCKCGSEFQVYCDMNLQGGGWTIIQRRVNDKVSFRRDYKTYQNGFGDFTENFWLGLDKLHCLTESADLNTELYIGLDSFINGFSSWAVYGSFSVDSEQEGYHLRVGHYSQLSVAGDSMHAHNNLKFSTYDKDQDGLDRSNCAAISEGGWWYNKCGDSNLNGKYYEGGRGDPHRGMVWETWLGSRYSVKTTVIAIRHTMT